MVEKKRKFSKQENENLWLIKNDLRGYLTKYNERNELRKSAIGMPPLPKPSDVNVLKKRLIKLRKEGRELETVNGPSQEELSKRAAIKNQRSITFLGQENDEKLE